MAWRFCLTNTCFALLPIVHSLVVPGNLPSQLEILSTGQTYYETALTIDVIELSNNIEFSLNTLV